MERLFWRRRLVKTGLSLTFAFATLLMIQKFRVVDIRMKELGIGLKSSRCVSVHCKTKGAVGTVLAAVHQRAPAAWNITKITCTENLSLRNQSWFQTLDSRFQKYVLYRHCRYFPMLMNHPETCRDVDLLIVVKSVIEQHDRREAVRLTWGKTHTIGKQRVKTLFLLGTSAPGKDSKNLQKLLEYENRLYGDILQWDFMDTFFNLTLKEINFLRWFNIYCTKVSFIFKGDDDVFVNPANLVDLIDFRTEEGKVHNMFVGDTISRALPIRHQQSKYYIPKELYNQRYPPYVGGGGFLMSSHLANRLFAVSESVTLFPIDDVFLGMCLQKLGLIPEMHAGFRTFGIVRRRSKMNSDPCFYRYLMVVHKMSPQELLRMWDMVHNNQLTCFRRNANDSSG